MLTIYVWLIQAFISLYVYLINLRKTAAQGDHLMTVA